MANNKRLIYAEDALVGLQYISMFGDVNDNMIQGAMRLARSKIENASTVDAIILSCKVGDTVYGQFHWHGKEIHECKVTRVKACQFKDESLHYFLDVEFDMIDHYYNDGRMMRCQNQAVFGEDYGSWNRVYLTKKEAELAKKAGDGK